MFNFDRRISSKKSEGKIDRNKKVDSKDLPVRPLGQSDFLILKSFVRRGIRFGARSICENPHHTQGITFFAHFETTSRSDFEITFSGDFKIALKRLRSHIPTKQFRSDIMEK